MATEYEMTKAEEIEWQDAEHPACDVCSGRIGMDCEGHSPVCYYCDREPSEREKNTFGDEVDMCDQCAEDMRRGQALDRRYAEASS